jgi:hypothetical protein
MLESLTLMRGSLKRIDIIKRRLVRGGTVHFLRVNICFEGRKCPLTILLVEYTIAHHGKRF